MEKTKKIREKTPTAHSQRLIELHSYLYSKGYVANSDRKFADAILATGSTISNIKNGTNKLGLDVANKIKDKFSFVNINWLLTGEGEMLLDEAEKNSDTADSTDYIAIVKNLSEEISYLREELQEYKKIAKLHSHATKTPPKDI